LKHGVVIILAVGPWPNSKLSTDFRHVAPFLQGQNVPNFGQNFDPDRLRTAVFLNCGSLSENKKTYQGPMIGLLPHQTWDRSVPPTLRSVGAMVIPEG